MLRHSYVKTVQAGPEVRPSLDRPIFKHISFGTSYDCVFYSLHFQSFLGFLIFYLCTSLYTMVV